MGKAGQLHMATLFLDTNSKIKKKVDLIMLIESHLLMLELNQELKTTHQMISNLL